MICSAQNRIQTLYIRHDFVSPDQIQEGNTVIEWYINGVLAAKGQSLDVSKISNASIMLKVTPYLKNPALPGETVTATTSISYSGSGSVSGGGSGRGSVSVAPGGSGIFDIIKIDETRLPQREYKYANMKEHWACDYAEKATEMNIMSGSDQDNFFPELIVTRAEFVVYITGIDNIKNMEWQGLCHQKSKLREKTLILVQSRFPKRKFPTCKIK